MSDIYSVVDTKPLKYRTTENSYQNHGIYG